MKEAGYVYILTNPSFKEDWVKIGKSSRPVDIRSKELDNTAVPLPFEIYATLKTVKYSEAEKLIHHESLRTTTLKTSDQTCIKFAGTKKEICIESNKDINVFLNFCNIYREYNNENKITDYQRIKMLWGTYAKSLCYESNYLNCFKYIYYIIDTVHKSPLDGELKKHYVGIIQAQLNHDILFCYLINQIIFNGGQDKDFTKVLKQYDFFCDIYKDNDNYGSIIKSTIPKDIIKQYR